MLMNLTRKEKGKEKVYKQMRLGIDSLILMPFRGTKGLTQPKMKPLMAELYIDWSNTCCHKPVVPTVHS